MAWRINKTELKRIRDERKLTHTMLAELTGLDRGTLARHEHPSGPSTMQYGSAQLIARVLECTEGDFVRWTNESAADADPETPQRVRAPGRTRKVTMTATTMTAAREASPVVETEEGVYRLVGAAQLHSMLQASRVYVGERLAVQGVVTDTEALSPQTAQQVGARAATGIRCRVQRPTEESQPLGVTVLTREPCHTRRMLDAWEGAAPVTAIVQVIVSPDDGSYPGFRAAPEIRGKRVPFALLVESLPEKVSLRYDVQKDSTTPHP